MFFTSLRTYQLLISDDISAATYDVGLCYFTIRSKYFHPLPRIINKCLLLFYYLSGSSSGSLSVHAHQNFNITQDYGKLAHGEKKRPGFAYLVVKSFLHCKNMKLQTDPCWALSIQDSLQTHDLKIVLYKHWQKICIDATGDSTF